MTDLRVLDTGLATDQVPGGTTAPRGLGRGGRAARSASVWGWGLAGILLVALIWEAYKLLAPADGVVVGETRILPRATDLAMPHVWDMVGRLAEPVTGSPSAEPLWSVVALAALTTLGIAAAGGSSGSWWGSAWRW